MPYTLYPMPYILYPIPYTLYPYPIPYTLYPISYILYPISQTKTQRSLSHQPYTNTPILTNPEPQIKSITHWLVLIKP